MQGTLDEKYGTLRAPSRLDHWEDRRPVSLCILDEKTAAAIASLLALAGHPLLRGVATAITLIWCVDKSGSVLIATEELAVVNDAVRVSGNPRLRAFGHLRDLPKLGHPTLLDGGQARIAGELAVDIDDFGPFLVLNFNSGRYCKEMPPNRAQMEAVAAVFGDFGLTVRIDEI